MIGFRCLEEAINWEHPDGSYGGYGVSYKYRVFLALNEYTSVESEVGAAALRSLEIFEKRLKDDLQVKYPNSGYEQKFRQDVLTALKSDKKHKIAASDIFLAITPKPLEDYKDKLHPFAIVDLDTYISDAGRLNSTAFGRDLSKIADAVEAGNDLFEVLGKHLAKAAGKPGWLDAFELKPGMFGFRIDLKKVHRIIF